MPARFKRNKKWAFDSSKAFSVFVGILFLIPIGFLAFSNWKISKKRTDLKAQLEILQKRAEDLEQRKNELKGQVFGPSEEDFWEKKVRDQGYKKPGEEVAVVLGPDNQASEKAEIKNLFEQILEKLKFW